MWRCWITGAGALTVALASCGPTATGPPTSRGSPTPTATAVSPEAANPSVSSTPSAAAGPLASCVGAAPTTPTLSASGPLIAVEPSISDVELVDTSGVVANQTAAAVDSSTGFNPVGQGPSGVYLYDLNTGDLEVLGPSGPPQELGQVTASSNLDSISLAESPNAQCWILADTTYDSNLNGTTRLYVSSSGGTPVLGATLRLDANQGGGYRVLRWDASGVLLGADPTGVGGGGPFIDESYSLPGVVSFDPLSGAVSSPLCKDGRFGDVAADGTVACVTGIGTDAQIVVTRPAGSTSTIDTGLPLAGQVAFVGGSSFLTYCTSDGVWNANGWTTNLLSVQLGSGTPSPVTLSSGDGPGENEDSYAWFKILEGTSIVETRVVGGTPSVVTIDLSTGGSTTIAPAQTILGVL